MCKQLLGKGAGDDPLLLTGEFFPDPPSLEIVLQRYSEVLKKPEGPSGIIADTRDDWIIIVGKTDMKWPGRDSITIQVMLSDLHGAVS
ncbi:MAG: hypothetical protein BWY93_02046 [Euryarchaeota archaeon ADurb.BinA087]|nr:MAG: hypothetical protein BWY93_02046 [Euryarchaeota archaeon ADurb.BinA087]